MRLGETFVLFALLAVAGCATNGELGLAHHPVDCAVGLYHSDCLPDTLGYRAPPVVYTQARPPVPVEAAPEDLGPLIPRGEFISTVSTEFCLAQGFTAGTPPMVNCEAQERADVAPRSFNTSQAGLRMVVDNIHTAQSRCQDAAIPAPSPAFSKCLGEAFMNIGQEMQSQRAAQVRLQQQEAAEAAAEQQQAAQNLAVQQAAAQQRSAAMLQLGAALLRGPQTVVVQPPPAPLLQPPVNCTSMRTGPMVSTTCR